MEYEEMIDNAYEKLSKLRKSDERFEIPQADILTQGNQTIIKNFSVICEKVRRDPKHVLKYLAKELAAPASIDGQRAILQTKVPASQIQRKIESYVKEFVFCKECTRPDTKLIKEGNATILKCEACGARASVKTK